MPQRLLAIVVLSGGLSSEHEISIKTGDVVADALDSSKYRVVRVTVPKTGTVFKYSDILREADVVFIAMHGAPGEDGTVQGFLELLGVPYTGSGVLASALAMDKAKSTELFAAYGLSVPRQRIFSAVEWHDNAVGVLRAAAGAFSVPCVVKPVRGGSSVGVAIVTEWSEFKNAFTSAFAHDNTVIVQEYVKGYEITCAVLDDGECKNAFALPPTQIIPKTSRFFDYRAKYTPGASDEVTPPRLPDKLITRIQSIALSAHQILGCSGMSRTDMILSKETLYVLETNTIPGMTETSLLPQAAAVAGISFPDMLDRIVRAAFGKK